jgi:hypothetical protein
MFTNLFLPCLMLTCFDQQLTVYPVCGLVVFPSFRPLFSSSSVLCFPSPLDLLDLSSLVGGIPTPLKNMKVRLNHHPNYWGN